MNSNPPRPTTEDVTLQWVFRVLTFLIFTHFFATIASLLYAAFPSWTDLANPWNRLGIGAILISFFWFILWIIGYTRTESSRHFKLGWWAYETQYIPGLNVKRYSGVFFLIALIDSIISQLWWYTLITITAFFWTTKSQKKK